MADLLPCPFCGSEPRTDFREGESLWSHAIVTKTIVTCPECDILFETEPGYEFEAPEAWNRRAARPLAIGITHAPALCTGLFWIGAGLGAAFVGMVWGRGHP